jgi:outer membrane protein OmpA-like peptidoglycan-associated protein
MSYIFGVEAIMSKLICSVRERNFPFLFIALFLFAVFSFNIVEARGQEEGKGKILDLVYIVQDLKGVTQNLQVKETKTEVKIELPGDILFDFDKWDIRPDAEPTLQKVADIINQYPKSRILVEGHTDSKGTHPYNVRLSQKRADSVRNWLVNKGGIEASRISTRGWAETKPVAPNVNQDGSDNPGGRQKNRRVEITIKKG